MQHASFHSLPLSPFATNPSPRLLPMSAWHRNINFIFLPQLHYNTHNHRDWSLLVAPAAPLRPVQEPPYNQASTGSVMSNPPTPTNTSKPRQNTFPELQSYRTTPWQASSKLSPANLLSSSREELIYMRMLHRLRIAM
jgi:hypothetical protein